MTRPYRSRRLLSIYFRQPQGVLFEIATTSPGFAVDEDRVRRYGHERADPPQAAGGRRPSGLLVLHHGRGACAEVRKAAVDRFDRGSDR